MTVFRVLIISAMLGFVTTRTILRDKFLLEQCPSSCTCNIVEKMVDCSNANFSEIPSEIDTNVTSLDLSFNKFSGIPMGIVNLPQLLDLDLSNNPMIRLIEINFQSTSLRSLKLRRCSIDYIDNSVFKGLPNLEVLNLSENPLNYLNNSLVSSSVKSLDLSNCNLKHLKALSFSGMTSLAYLSLKNNHNLRLLHSDSDSLLTLDVSNCNLEHVPTGPLRKIVELDLHGNNIQWLRNRTFSNITNVENLNISYNAIKQIEVNSFSHLSYLTIIDLSYNRLATIEKNTFKRNERLKYLHLSHNYLRIVEGISSNSLEMLDLSNCEINILRRYSLRNLPALTEIHLHRNQISYLPDNLEASHLVYFDIANNDINSINNQTFTSLRSLRFLILSGNKLTTIDPSFFPQVVDLYIEDNPWLCDCDSLQQMYNWMIRTDQNVKQLKCQLPAKVEGLTWEEACYNTWSKVYIPQRSVWWYSLSFFITLGILLLLIYISKKVDERRKNEMEQQAEERRAVEQLEFIQRQQTRERLRRLEEQEESRNAPDPRESQGPPTYNEALLLPRLDASHPSLAGSLPSLSSIQGSNQDISKRRRQRRKRRRKRSNSSNPEPNGASNVNATDQSDNDRHTEMEESSF